MNEMKKIIYHSHTFSLNIIIQYDMHNSFFTSILGAGRSFDESLHSVSSIKELWEDGLFIQEQLVRVIEGQQDGYLLFCAKN